jgi:hypothetical protein
LELVRLCGPFDAIVSCGRHGESGALEPGPVCVPGVVVGDVLEPRGCVCVVLPFGVPVLCAIAGTASATASAAPPAAVISVLFICPP